MWQSATLFQKVVSLAEDPIGIFGRFLPGAHRQTDDRHFQVVGSQAEAAVGSKTIHKQYFRKTKQKMSAQTGPNPGT